MRLEEYLESLWIKEEKTLSEMNKMFSWIEDLDNQDKR